MFCFDLFIDKYFQLISTYFGTRVSNGVVVSELYPIADQINPNEMTSWLRVCEKIFLGPKLSCFVTCVRRPSCLKLFLIDITVN